MNDYHESLMEIRKLVSKDPKHVDSETRRAFWRIVRQIKESAYPKPQDIALASEIRNLLFRGRRGRTYPLWPCVGAFFLIGLIPVTWYLQLLSTPLDTSNILSWTDSDWWLFLRRLGSLLAATFFFYPLGRLFAGHWAGIRIDGMSGGMYREPTLKIDYQTFLSASPSKRKWFFFFAGAWTIITSLSLGMIGWFLAGDIGGFIAAAFLIISEGLAILSGTTKSIGGEMAHYNREKKTEKAWEKNRMMENASPERS
jgi:hypothetical protein